MKTYLILDTGSNMVKIGKSNDVEKRLGILQIGNPSQLVIKHVFSRDIERVLHRYFKSRRVRGEWFDVPCDEIVKLVKDKKLLARPHWKSIKYPCDLNNSLVA